MKKTKEENPKIHLDLDGSITACGLDLYEFDGELAEDLEEVTCQRCRNKYRSMVQAWDLSWKKELKEREREKRINEKD